MAADLPLSGIQGYIAFLKAQGEVRSALDEAFEYHAPLGIAAPPSQTALINADLQDLGEAGLSAKPIIRFANAYESLGAAWVVAGSSMGNRTMLARRRKSGYDTANAFFADASMPAYFTHVVKILNTPFTEPEQQQICAGACRTFALFEGRFAAIGQACAA